MNIPQKLKSGDEVKTSTFRAINGIIDYLNSLRIIGDGRTIIVSQTPSGTTISAIQKPAGRPQTGGGGGALTLGVITNRPPNGFGAATYKVITVNADGSWVASGEDIPIVIPEF